MIIMKDSTDPPWISVGDVYREAKRKKRTIVVTKEGSVCGLWASDYVYTAGRLIVFFTDSIGSSFRLHDRVLLETGCR